MKKSYQCSFGKFYLGHFEEPIRTQKDATKLVLMVTNLLLCGTDDSMDKQGELYICIDKMSRFFCFLKMKYFSMQFPFMMEIDLNGKVRIYDLVSDLTIDFRILGLLTSILKEIDFQTKTMEQIIENAYFDVASEEYTEQDVEICMGIIMRLLTTEYGYLRYDYDKEHFEPYLHPLTHIDINFMDNVTYKLGVQSLVAEDFIDLVDVRKECKKIV